MNFFSKAESVLSEFKIFKAVLDLLLNILLCTQVIRPDELINPFKTSLFSLYKQISNVDKISFFSA